MRILTQPFHDQAKSEREGVRTRDGHLLREFERDPRVSSIVLVNRPLSAAEALAKRRSDFNPRSFITRCELLRRQVSPSVEVVQVSIPHVVKPVLQARDFWTSSLRVPRVVAALRAEVAAADVLLLSNPMAFPMVELANPRMVVAFDAIDDWLNHPQISDKRGFIAEGYATILRRADVVVTNSRVMLGRLQDRGANRPVLVPNGIKEEWMELPPWEAPAGQVTLGYAGKLAQRIDVTLLAGLARRHPEWRIELAGPTLDSAWIAPLRSCKNVNFVGDVPHTALPERFRRWHVALIPHNVGALENGGHPIKVYEYLSLGMPVVSTRIAELEDLVSVIAIADSHTKFEEAVLEALHRPGTPEEVRARRQAVKSFTWSSSAAQIVDLIEQVRT